MMIGDVVSAVLEADELGQYLDKGRDGVVELAVNLGWEWCKSQPGVAAALDACDAYSQAGGNINCEATAKEIGRQAVNYAITQAHLWPVIDEVIWIWQHTPAALKAVIKLASSVVKAVGNVIETGIKEGANWVKAEVVQAWKSLTDPKRFIEQFKNVPIIGNLEQVGGTLLKGAESIPVAGPVISGLESLSPF